MARRGVCCSCCSTQKTTPVEVLVSACALPALAHLVWWSLASRWSPTNEGQAASQHVVSASNVIQFTGHHVLWFVDHQAGLDPQHGTHRLVTITMCMHARASSQLLREAGRRAEALRAAQLTLHCHLSSTSDRTTWQNQCMTQQSAAVMRSASSEETLLALSLSLVFLHKLGKLVHLLCQLSLHAAMPSCSFLLSLEHFQSMQHTVELLFLGCSLEECKLETQIGARFPADKACIHKNT